MKSRSIQCLILVSGVLCFQNCGNSLDAWRAEEPESLIASCKLANVDCQSEGSTLLNTGGNSDFGKPDVRCQEHEVLVAGQCRLRNRPCSVPFGWGMQSLVNQRYGACAAINCDEGFHLESGACFANLKDCDMDHRRGVQRWLGDGYSDCALSDACVVDYHLEDSACVLNYHECELPNGLGQRYWGGENYSSCQAEHCNEGYEVRGSRCIRNLNNVLGKNFVSACRKDKGSSYSYKTAVKVGWNQELTQSTLKYGDAKCTQPALVIEEKFEYEIERMVDEVAGVFAINLFIVNSKVTLFNDGVAKKMNKEKYCGVTNWVKGAEYIFNGKSACMKQRGVSFQIGRALDNQFWLGAMRGRNNGSSEKRRPRQLGPAMIGE